MVTTNDNMEQASRTSFESASDSFSYNISSDGGKFACPVSDNCLLIASNATYEYIVSFRSMSCTLYWHGNTPVARRNTGAALEMSNNGIRSARA